MKKILLVSLLLAAIMLLAPLKLITDAGKGIPVTSLKVTEILPEKKNSTSFTVCDSESGKMQEIKVDDYIFGVVAAEMPALYEEEALKAQAVAAYTFACLRKAENSDKSYDITTDYTADQSYISEEDAKKKWGSNADIYTEKIKNAVKSVSGYMITYNNKPITAVYHAISSGKTEDSENVWGLKKDYLKPVASEGDKLSPDYITKVTFTADELKTALNGVAELSGEPKSYFSEIKRTESNTVISLNLCNKEFTGARIRSLLNLRSSCFDVKFEDDKFVFTVYGYGHGVGMSQNGANYMAKQGSDFKEILTWYYTGCKVEKAKN